VEKFDKIRKKQVQALQGKGIRKNLEEGGSEHYHKKAVRPGMKNISTRAAYGCTSLFVVSWKSAPKRTPS
jgi:hypothetical protein